jgi:hypothetical protein
MAYFFIDASNLIKKILRMIYRLLIPKKIRSVIWEKRMNINDNGN